VSISEESVADIRRRMASCQESLRRGEKVEPAEIFAVMYENSLETEELTREERLQRLLLLAETQRGLDPEGAIALVRAAARLAPRKERWLREWEQEIQRGRAAGHAAREPVATKRRRS
jgi:hypothetical protein